MDERTDEQLMIAVLKGDGDALTELVERYHGPLLGYLCWLLNGDRSLAEDLVQETYLRLLKSDSFQHERPFKPWLYAIATNLARDYSRKERHRVHLRDESMEGIYDDAPGPEEVAIIRDEARVVAQAIALLSETHRVVLLLRFYVGLSLQEIANTLEIPVGTVKSRLCTGTHRLREVLGEVNKRQARP
jgi:RNA polymerase sigma-70 factor (ECF subfamily)